MLTRRQNFIETLKGGNPDRFVNQYEALAFMRGGNPVSGAHPMVSRGGDPIVDGWGVTRSWPAEVPGPFPVHAQEFKVIQDITKWRDVVHHPSLDFPDEAWADAHTVSESIDRNEYLATLTMAPGVFEQVHYLMSIDDALLAFYTEPEAMHELIDYITDYELAYGALLLKHYKPDALLHHDDWGSHNSSFMSPEMFDEFFLPAYKKIYGFHKANGVQYIVHHSDSYAANLVPEMIEMGVDVFQGCVTTNNVPELVKKYGGKISFMGDLNNGVLDIENCPPELIAREVDRACRTNGKLYFIPCLTAGGPGSSYPGIYDAVSAEIDRFNREEYANM